MGRSALIAAMVALPVAGLAGIAVVYDSAQLPTISETIDTVLGQTEAQLVVATVPHSNLRQDPHSHSWTAEGTTPAASVLASPADVLPPGTEIITVTPSSVTAETANGTATFDVLEGETWHPSLAGRFDVLGGRVPRTDQEVMVTASSLPRLGVSIGEVFRITSPTPMEVRVVGVLDDQKKPDSSLEIFTRNGVVTGAEFEEGAGTHYYLPELTLRWDDVLALNTEGITAVSRDVLLHGPPANDLSGSSGLHLTMGALLAMFAAFAAFEVILLAGAAFTVTARQQQRMLATIASVGAPRRLLFRILAANGVILGLVGGIVGCVLGVTAAIAYMTVTADGSSTQYYGLHVSWLALAGCIAFAALIGWIASLAPARNASRFDVVAALRGARKPPKPNRQTPTIGVVMMLTGLVLTIVGGALLAAFSEGGRGTSIGHPLLWLPLVMMIAGPLLLQVGLMLCGPLILRLIAKVLSHRGIGARLASRDVARNPSRAVPALAAVMTTVFVSTVSMCMISAGEQNSRNEHIYTALVGQIRVDLRYAESSPTSDRMTPELYKNPGAVAEIVRATIGTDNVRILSNVADPFAVGYDELGNPIAAEGELAMPTVPPSNLCPLNPQSPSFDEEVAYSNSAEMYELLDDTRCQSSFLETFDGENGHLFVGDVDDLALVLGRQPSQSAREALKNGGAVSLYPEYLDDGRFTISWWNAADAVAWGYNEDPGHPLRTATLPAVVDSPAHDVNFGAFISADTADGLGLDYGPAVVVASAEAPPTRDQSDALNSALSTLPDVPSGWIYAKTESGPPQYAAIWAWALLALASLIALASAAVAIGLARFDGRQDDATLASLGASPGVRRSFAFWQALILTGVGVLVGTAIGLVPALALSAMQNFPFSPPWLQIGLIVVALPAVISVGSWVLTHRSRLSARRLTVG
ncbi:MAG: FtsX-like permease family protein [Microbacteriaceae bacterium]